MFDDWDLIEASFAMQYPGKNLYDESMDWVQFSALLAGIMPETPLGQIVSIRSEEDPRVLKSFTAEQHQIRNNWREKKRQEQLDKLTSTDMEKQIVDLQNMMAHAFR
ncbi:Gp15 family bacteriophage protein [Copranaerobaculum intestinale]|uniref:Gp15 family bacteriophage protein n=1 Tax=Copranaerobaculum intestinale TaxID=2692629 RepID=UPI00201BCCBC|nr:Gp15 family bacteriophage protein [Copranaerobaculum intestinale]